MDRDRKDYICNLVDSVSQNPQKVIVHPTYAEFEIPTSSLLSFGLSSIVDESLQNDQQIHNKVCFQLFQENIIQFKMTSQTICMMLKLMQDEIPQNDRPIHVVSNYNSAALMNGVNDSKDVLTKESVEKVLMCGGLVNGMSQPYDGPLIDQSQIDMWNAQMTVTIVMISNCGWVAKSIQHEIVDNNLTINVSTLGGASDQEDPTIPKDEYDKCLHRLVTSGFMKPNDHDGPVTIRFERQCVFEEVDAGFHERFQFDALTAFRNLAVHVFNLQKTWNQQMHQSLRLNFFEYLTHLNRFRGTVNEDQQQANEVVAKKDDALRMLSIRYPWAGLILIGEKKIENRRRPLPSYLEGKWIALHAGQKIDKAECKQNLTEYFTQHILGMCFTFVFHIVNQTILFRFSTVYVG